jgi:hypothetical protein
MPIQALKQILWDQLNITQDMRTSRRAELLILRLLSRLEKSSFKPIIEKTKCQIKIILALATTQSLECNTRTQRALMVRLLKAYRLANSEMAVFISKVPNSFNLKPDKHAGTSLGPGHYEKQFDPSGAKSATASISNEAPKRAFSESNPPKSSHCVFVSETQRGEMWLNKIDAPFTKST